MSFVSRSRTFAAGRKTKLTYPDGTFETWSYDPAGNVAVFTRRGGVTITYTYDNRHRLTYTDFSDTTPDETRQYDAVGRLTLVQNGLTYVYKNYNQAGEEIFEAQHPVEGGNHAYKQFWYGYYPDGQREWMVTPSSGTYGYGYSHRKEPTYVYHNQEQTFIAAYTYDPAGRRTNRDFRNAQNQIVARTEYTYDPADQLTAIAHFQGTTPKQWEEYSYDAIGRRINTEYNGTNTFDLYTYDAIGQIKEVKYQAVDFVNPIKTQSWTYDPVGNRLTTTDTQAGNSTYQVLAGNKYGTVMHNNVGGGLSYDARGNMHTDGSGWVYIYDAKNRLIGARNHPVIDAATQRYEFVYDGLNRRVIEKHYTKASGSATWTLSTPPKYRYYDGWNLVEVHEPVGTNTPTRLLEAYVHGPRVDETIRYRRYQYDSNGNVISTGSYYLQEDALGSTIRILDAQTGNGMLRVRYDVFGKASFAHEGTPNNYTYYNSVSLRFLYTGREMLVSEHGIGSGLMDYRNRIYSQRLGRFLQPDPIGFDAGDVNWYRYVGNSPLDWIDSDGLFKTYKNRDDAGHEAGKEALDRSRKGESDPSGKSYEYCGLICQKCENGNYIYARTGPVKGNASKGNNGSCNPWRAPACATLGNGWEYSGWYHSHPAGGDMSPSDKKESSPDAPGYMTRDKKGHRGSKGQETYRSDGGNHSERVRW
jgi:RHS repeat-associated protein